LNEDTPTLSAAKCRPMTLVSGNIRYVRILAGVPLGWASNESGVVDDGNFWLFEWLLLRKLQGEAGNIIRRYAAHCRPVIDCKMKDQTFKTNARTKDSGVVHKDQSQGQHP